MLKIDLAAGFHVGDVLALPSRLLHKFVRDEKTHGVVGHGDSQAVATREITFVGTREACGVSPVGKVLQDGRIEIAVGMKSVGARRKTIHALNEGDACGSRGGSKAS